MTSVSPSILGVGVHPTSYEDAAARAQGWLQEPTGRYVCAANVHMIMEAYDSPEFRSVVNGADLVAPDGVPLVWMLRALGFGQQQRVYGPDLALRLCRVAEEQQAPVALYGGTPESLADFIAFLTERFPALEIACAISPPFRAPTPEEDAADTRRITESGARLVLVGIGCPKQEKWMAAHRARIPALMVGVGAAFDFFSGRVKQAPAWMQRCGLEWLFRLLVEPRRLWKRYLKHNPRFVALALWQLTKQKGGLQ